MRLLDSCAGIRPECGVALQGRVWEAVRAHPQPPEAVVSQLLLALSLEMFDPTNAVATKAVVAAVLSMQRAARADAARQLEEGGLDLRLVPLRLGQEQHPGASGGLVSDDGGEGGTPRGGGSQQGTPRGGETGVAAPGGTWAPRTGGGTPSPDSSPVGAPRRAHLSQGSDDTFTSTPGKGGASAGHGMALMGTLHGGTGLAPHPAGVTLGTPGQRPPQGVALHMSSPMSAGHGGEALPLGVRGGANSGGGWTSPPPRARSSPRTAGQHLGASPQHTSDNVGGSAANAMSTVAPPFWAGRPPWADATVTCPSQLGGWPGGSREDAAAFMAALTAFCAQASPAGGDAGGAAHLSGSSHSWSGFPPPSLPLRVPAFAGELLDLPGLYREVCMRGGGAAVTAAGLWPTVAAALHLPSTQQEACKALTGHYARLLAAYEEAHFDATAAPDGAARHQHLCGRSGREGGSAMLTSEEGGDGGGYGGGGAMEEGFSPRTGGSDSACTTSPGGRSVGGAGCRFTEAEDAVIMRARLRHGNKWTAMEALLPGRSVGSIKKHWHSTLKYKEAALVGLAARGSTGSMASLGSGESLNTLVPPSPADSAGAGAQHTQMHASTHALSAQLGVTALGGDYHGAGAMQRPDKPGSSLGAPPRAVAARLSYGQQQLQQQLQQLQQQQQQVQMQLQLQHQQQQQQQQAAAMHATGYGDVQAPQFVHHGQQAGVPVGPWYTAPQAAAAVHPGHVAAAPCVGPPPVGHTRLPGNQMLMPLLASPAAPAWAVPVAAGMAQQPSAAAHLSAVAASLGQLPQGISFTVGPGGTLYWQAPGTVVHPEALFNARG